MRDLDYWKEHVVLGAEEVGVELSDELVTSIAASVQGGHENYNLGASYPSGQDMLDNLRQEYERKIARMEEDRDKYEDRVSSALRKALRLGSHASVSIDDRGQVILYDGRSVVVQS